MIEVIPGERTSPGDRRRRHRDDRGRRLPALAAQEGGARASSRTASSTRSCASAWRSWTRASSTCEELDTNVKWGIGYKLAVIPPMQLLDMAGLDIYSAVASYLNPDLSNERASRPTIQDLVGARAAWA